MVFDQLKRDSKELAHNIHKYKQRGRRRTAYKLLKKQLEIDSTLMQLKGGI